MESFADFLLCNIKLVEGEKSAERCFETEIFLFVSILEASFLYDIFSSKALVA